MFLRRRWTFDFSLLFSSLLFSSLLFSSLLFPSLLSSSLLFTSPHFPSLHFTSLLFSSLRFSSLLFSSLLFSTSLHFSPSSLWRLFFVSLPCLVRCGIFWHLQTCFLFSPYLLTVIHIWCIYSSKKLIIVTRGRYSFGGARIWWFPFLSLSFRFLGLYMCDHPSKSGG